MLPGLYGLRGLLGHDQSPPGMPRDSDRRMDQDRRLPSSPVARATDALSDSLFSLSPLHVNVATSLSPGSSPPSYSPRPILGGNVWNLPVNSPTSSDGSTFSSVDVSDLMSSLSLSPPSRLYVAPFEQDIANVRALYNINSNQLTNVLASSSRLQGNLRFSTGDYNFGRSARPVISWVGELPRRFEMSPTYSCKVFLGGVPWDLTEETLMAIFLPFGRIRVEWPGKENTPMQPKGFVYVIFDTESQVKLLLSTCLRDISSGNYENYFYRIVTGKVRPKVIQVIPWRLSDTNYVKVPSQKLDPHMTVFVGGLHGMLSAEGLYKIMDDLFGGVTYVGIDTDRCKYPIGSARVTFNNKTSYVLAVKAAFVDIKTSKFTKKVQVDPYLEDSICSKCTMHPGPFFCKEFSCFKYFCTDCWFVHHHSFLLRGHQPMSRSSKYAKENSARYSRFGSC